MFGLPSGWFFLFRFPGPVISCFVFGVASCQYFAVPSGTKERNTQIKLNNFLIAPHYFVTNWYQSLYHLGD